MLHFLLLVLTLVRTHVGCRIVRVVGRRDILALAHGRHALFVCFHVIIFFVGKSGCVEIFNEPSKFLLALIFGYGLWIDLPFLNKPGVKFWSFGEQVGFANYTVLSPLRSRTRALLFPLFLLPFFPLATSVTPLTMLVLFTLTMSMIRRGRRCTRDRA